MAVSRVAVRPRPIQNTADWAANRAAANDIVPVARTMVTRGVLVDVAHHRGVAALASDEEVTIADLEATLPKVWGRRVGTIFIGGGTPSLFSPQAIDRLLTAVRTRIGVDPEAEITMEANPGTFERERFRGYRDAGVTRLSVGVQLHGDGGAVANFVRVAVVQDEQTIARRRGAR